MKKTRILVTGLSGFIGSRFNDLFSDRYEIVGFIRDGDKSVENRRYVSESIRGSRADIILHLAARTHIDRCEKDRREGKRSPSWKINVEGTENIAAACVENNRFMVYLSTECVFDGQKGWYKETDSPSPVNWYGETKLAGENFISESGCRHLILRSTLAYGHQDNYKYDLFRFFRKNLSAGEPFTAVCDQYLSLTFIDDLVKVLGLSVDKQPEGILHYAGSRAVSPYEFVSLLAGKLKLKNTARPVTLKEYFGTKAALRLKNATLSSEKISRSLDIEPSDLDKSLARLVKEE